MCVFVCVTEVRQRLPVSMSPCTHRYVSTPRCDPQARVCSVWACVRACARVGVARAAHDARGGGGGSCTPGPDLLAHIFQLRAGEPTTNSHGHWTPQCIGELGGLVDWTFWCGLDLFCGLNLFLWIGLFCGLDVSVDWTVLVCAV